MIELIGSDHNVKLSDKQLDELALLLKREETLLLEDQIERALEKQFLEEEQKDNSKTSSKVELHLTFNKCNCFFLKQSIDSIVILIFNRILRKCLHYPKNLKTRLQPLLHLRKCLLRNLQYQKVKKAHHQNEVYEVSAICDEL